MSHETERFEGMLSQILERLDDHGRILSVILLRTGTQEEALRENLKETKLWNGERLFDNQDLCIMLQVSKRSLQRYRSLGLLPYIMLRQKTYYKESDVMRFLSVHLQDLKKEEIEAYEVRLKKASPNFKN